MTSAVVLVLAVFAACVVESVEALTIVLAVGITRGWSATLRGVVTALAVLAVVVAVLGPTLTVIPISVLRLVVGGLLLVFGLGWLRKAVLRASGFKGLHDEDAIYARERAAAEQAPREPGRSGAGRGWIGDPYAFTLAFKGVLLEGLEVVFIVLTFGTNQHAVGLAAIGAVAAVVLVTIAGVAARAPLSRVPENSLKFVVGVLLTSFGAFWGVEGAGGGWPGGDLALVALVAFVFAMAAGAVWWLRRLRTRPADLGMRTARVTAGQR